VEVGDAVNRVRERLTTLGLGTSLDRVLTVATPTAAAEITRLLDSPRFADSPAMTAAALGELTARTESTGALDTAAAVAVTSAMTATGAGEGLARLESGTAAPLAAPALVRLATGTEWRAVDSDLRIAPREEVSTVATRLLGVVRETPREAPERPRPPAKARKAAKRPARRKKGGEQP